MRILITSVEERRIPSKHIVYRLEIKEGVRGWVAYHRYQDFDSLHRVLSKRFPGVQPPATLPPKHSLFNRSTAGIGSEFIENRRELLEIYLNAILQDASGEWRESEEFSKFLETPRIKHVDILNITSEDWLDELKQIEKGIREARAALAKRDALRQDKQVSAAHRATLEAKNALTPLDTRIVGLEDALKAMGNKRGDQVILSSGELSRRMDMLNRVKDEKSVLTKLCHVSMGSVSEAGTSLLAPPTPTHPKVTPNTPKGSTRVFGNTRALPQETEATAGRNNDELLTFQQQLMQNQDQNLDDFSTILQRQKQLGLTIHQELESQNRLLEELDDQVDRSGSKLKRASKQLKQIN
ncbi:Phox-like protein [Basidiobolus meristosporus CBS 931.73]|uniref:Phox-like protein n=1 Tax=Basidiobolus meristosporus CBS 931.73 TaxID=1314790 RepID=A0A1Y1Z0M8_9FUNG|nr:Phox-like protein [Basidiobolus meristosporus CBS 931.73]|eukprot:ORY03769.1 Phox-like protein [Basidiobolus meristosporus CBS 931.73]